jgi:hypothetical protein
MAYRKYGALIASLGVTALVFAANGASARSGNPAQGLVGAKHPVARNQVLLHRFNRRNNFNGTVWPAYDDSFYGPSTGEPGLTQPIPTDIRNSQAYEIPWDWAHRYPPIVVPTERPYVSSCSAETVNVPGREGKEQAVNILRCY